MSIRNRGLAAFVLICASVIALPNPSAAGEQNLFDHVLTINKWHLHASRYAFNAADVREAQIKISKMTAGRQARHGFVILNGRMTFIGDFLTADQQVFKKAVNLKTANSLYVFLLGQPGAAISLQVFVDDVLPPAPEITTFTAEPPTIKRGQPAILSWKTLNADSCLIEPDIGVVEPDGLYMVTPTDTTTYTLTAKGRGDPATTEVTVTIENSAPVAEP